jgi:hypothetical protein
MAATNKRKVHKRVQLSVENVIFNIISYLCWTFKHITRRLAWIQGLLPMKKTSPPCLYLLPWLVFSASSLSCQTVLAQTSAFTGPSIYTATGYQYGSVKISDVRVSGTNVGIRLPNYYSNGSFWLTGLNYTHVFKNNLSLGGQVEYYPISQQLSISISPGYAFNDRFLGYLKLGWVNGSSTVDQGPGRQPYKVNLNGVVAGAGIKASIFKGVFGYAEFNYAQFERLSFTSWAGPFPISGNADTKAYSVVIGLGYKF